MTEESSAATRSWLSRCVPSLGGWLVLAVFAGLLLPARATTMISADGDFSMHLTLGRILLEHGPPLLTEPTTWAAAGKPFIAYEWLTQWGMAFADRASGLMGPIALGDLLIALTFGGVWAVQRRQGAGLWVAAVLTPLALMAAGAHLLIRPHLVTWALLVGFHGLLEAYRTGTCRGSTLAAVAIPGFALWANMHGGFVLGGVLLGAHGLGTLLEAATPSLRPEALARFVRLFGLGVLVMLATGLNPYGFALHTHILEFAGDPILGMVTEFLPPTWDGGWGSIVLVALPATLGLALWARRDLPLPHAVVLAVFAWLTLDAARNFVVFALLAAMILGPAVQRALERRAAAGSGAAQTVVDSSARLDAVEGQLGDPWATLAYLGLGTLALGIAGASGVQTAHFDPTLLPVAAMDHVLAQPDRYTGRLHNTYHYGGYISLRAYPGILTSMNSFADHLGVAHAVAEGEIEGAVDGWERALEAQRVTWALLHPDMPLAAAMAESPGWQLEFEDPAAVVYRRARAAQP